MSSNEPPDVPDAIPFAQPETIDGPSVADADALRVEIRDLAELISTARSVASESLSRQLLEKSIQLRGVTHTLDRAVSSVRVRPDRSGL